MLTLITAYTRPSVSVSVPSLRPLNWTSALVEAPSRILER